MYKRIQAPELLRFGTLTVFLFLLALSVFAWQTWRHAKEEKINDIKTVLELAAKSSDQYFLRMQASLADLSADFSAGPGFSDLSAAQRLLRKFHDHHADLLSVGLMNLNGQLLALSTTPNLVGLPVVSNQVNFLASIAVLKPESPLDLAAPLYYTTSQSWVFPMRYAIRDTQGRLVAFLVAAAPVDMLGTFWPETLAAFRASIFLERDDGYLINLYPLNPSTNYQAMFSLPRSGTLRNHLRGNNFPSSGQVEGLHSTSRQQYVDVFKRLEHFPATMAISMRGSELQAIWWNQYRLSLILFSVMALSIGLGLLYFLRQQNKWIAEQFRTSNDLNETLRQVIYSQEHAVAALNEQADAVIRLEVHGNVTLVNDAFCRLVGVDRESVVGLPWQRSKLPQDIYETERQMAALSVHAPLTEVENRVITANGSVRWYDWINTGTFDASGRLLAMQSVGRDVTERHEAEDRLKELVSMLDSDLLAIFKLKSGVIAWQNKSAQKMFGYDSQELMDKPPRILFRDDESFRRSSVAITLMLANGKNFRGRIELVRNNGEPIIVSCFANVLSAEQEEWLWVLFADSEVTLPLN